jgi:hypothetical protein
VPEKTAGKINPAATLGAMRLVMLALAMVVVLGSCQGSKGDSSSGTASASYSAAEVVIGGITFDRDTSGNLADAGAQYSTADNAHFLPYGSCDTFLDLIYTESSARGVETVRMDVHGYGETYALHLAKAVDGVIYIIAQDDTEVVPRVFLPAALTADTSWIGGFDGNRYTVVSTNADVPRLDSTGAIHLLVSDPADGSVVADAYYIRDFGFVLISAANGNEGWDRPFEAIPNNS